MKDNNFAFEFIEVGKAFSSGSKKKQVFTKFSLAVHRNEVFGFLGPNGAGKSTTIKLLLNFLRPDSGSIKILGHLLGEMEYRHLVGYLPEFPFFYDHLSAHETMLLSGRLGGVSNAVLRQRIPLLLERMHLSEAANQRVGEFSKGMKQRLGMANALIHDPQILIFDEPMSGLDPLGRHLIKGLISELRTQGKTVFFSSHILSDIEDLCDQIGVIHRGRLLYSGSMKGFMVHGISLEQRFVEIIHEADNAWIA